MLHFHHLIWLDWCVNEFCVSLFNVPTNRCSRLRPTLNVVFVVIVMYVCVCVFIFGRPGEVGRWNCVMFRPSSASDLPPCLNDNVLLVAHVKRYLQNSPETTQRTGVMRLLFGLIKLEGRPRGNILFPPVHPFPCRLFLTRLFWGTL